MAFTLPCSRLAPRLDKRSFWASLPGSGAGSGGWQELTGVSDPVALAGSYVMTEGSSELLLTLRAYNRWVV